MALDTVKALFSDLDKNGDGTLDLEELTSIFRVLDPSMKDKEIAKLFKSVDKDHSGSVDCDEFLDYLFQKIPSGARPPRAPDLKYTEYRAITLGQLKGVYKDITARCVQEEWTSTNPSLEGQRLTPESVVLYDANKYVILTQTEERQCSYVELVADGPQPPRYFVSHWWGEPVHDFLTCLEVHAKNRGGKKAKTDFYAYWVCAYANNQWDLGADLAVDPADTSFRRAIDISLGTVVIVDRGVVVFSRIWCCYEEHVSLEKSFDKTDTSEYTLDVYTVLEDDQDCAVGITDGLCAADGGRANGKSLREAAFPLRVAQAVLDIDLAKANASQEIDKTRILNAIAASDDLDAPPPEEHPEYDELNQRLRGRFVAGVLETLMKSGENMEEYGAAMKFSQLRSFNVSLYDVPLSDQTAESFASWLPDTLSDCMINFKSSAYGSETVLRALGGKTDLSKVSVHCDKMDAGVQGFVTGLPAEGLPCLEECYFLYCTSKCPDNVGDAGGMALAGALSGGLLPSLRKLSLEGHCMSAEGLDALAAAVEDHPTLKVLDLRFVSGSAADSIRQACAKQGAKVRF